MELASLSEPIIGAFLGRYHHFSVIALNTTAAEGKWSGDTGVIRKKHHSAGINI
jgi:hypothetical protein